MDDLRMPVGYQPPKFQQFEDKVNPKQHIAHFVEKCNNVGTKDDHLVKQFVHDRTHPKFHPRIQGGPMRPTLREISTENPALTPLKIDYPKTCKRNQYF